MRKLLKKELLCKTVDEVRKDRFKLPALPDKAGAVVIGLAKPTQPQPQGQGINPFNQDGTPKSPQQIADEKAALDAQQTSQPQSPAAKPAVAQAKQESPPQLGADASEVTAAEKKSKPESPDEKSISRTLPTLMCELGQSVMDGKMNKDEALSRGRNMIIEYSRLEDEQALLWVKHRVNFPGVAIIPPEMRRKLDNQHKRFLSDLETLVFDADAFFKKKTVPVASGAA
jgi:hypothetical protein